MKVAPGSERRVLRGVWLAAWPAATVLAGLFGGCPSTATSVSGSFVGRLAGTDVLVAIVTDGDQVLAYASDGDQTAKWYEGSIGGGEITLDSPAGDSTLTLTLDDAGGSGQIALADGQTASFDVAPAEGQSGLYVATKVVDDAKYLGCWVVLPDGTRAGVVMTETQIIDSTPLDLTTLESETPAAGKLQAAKFVPLSSGFGGGFNFSGGLQGGVGGFNLGGGLQGGVGGFNFGGGLQGGGGFNFGGAGFQFGGFQFGGFQFGGGGFNFGQ